MLHLKKVKLHTKIKLPTKMNLWELSVHKVSSVKKNLLYSQYKFDFDLCKLINLGYETTKSHVVAD